MPILRCTFTGCEMQGVFACCFTDNVEVNSAITVELLKKADVAACDRWPR